MNIPVNISHPRTSILSAWLRHLSSSCKECAHNDTSEIHSPIYMYQSSHTMLMVLTSVYIKYSLACKYSALALFTYTMWLVNIHRLFKNLVQKCRLHVHPVYLPVPPILGYKCSDHLNGIHLRSWCKYLKSIRYKASVCIISPIALPSNRPHDCRDFTLSCTPTTLPIAFLPTGIGVSSHVSFF